MSFTTSITSTSDDQGTPKVIVETDSCIRAITYENLALCLHTLSQES